MNDYVFRNISEAIQLNAGLTHLEIVYNEIGDDALEVMARSIFTENRQIKNVILNNNRIGHS